MTYNPIVVFYSRTGTNRMLAQEIAEELEAGLHEIVDLKRRMGPIGWLRSGYDAFRGRLTQIEFEVDLTGYDPVVIGTPVWSGRMTPAVRTLLGQQSLRGKRVAFFSVSGFGKPESAFKAMKALTNGSEFLGTLSLSVNEFKSTEHHERVKSFTRLIKEACQTKPS